MTKAKNAEQQVADFNAQISDGTAVFYRPILGQPERHPGTVRGRAFVDASGQPVVKLDGPRGGTFHLDHVEPCAFLATVPGLGEFVAGLKPETPEETAAREDREAEVDAAARRSSVSRAKVLLDRGVPAVDLDLILGGDLKPTPAMVRTKAWLAGDLGAPRSRILVLGGPGDASKSTSSGYAASQEATASDLLWWTSKSGIAEVVYLEAEFMLMAYQCRSGREPITGLGLADLMACRLLVIDDLGQEPAPTVEMIGDALDVLLRRRSDRLLRTLVATNLPTPAALCERYDSRKARLHETLVQHGSFYPCKTVGLRRKDATT